MEYIRQARESDAGRVAEIFVTNYRVNFYPFFHNDEFYFKELNVIDTVQEYAENPDWLRETFVYDDGVVKGFIRVKDDELVKLYVEPTFQSGGIGAGLLEFAVEELGVSWLWALEYNARGISFYKRHGFVLTGEKMTEDEWVPLVKLVKH